MTPGEYQIHVFKDAVDLLTNIYAIVKAQHLLRFLKRFSILPFF